MTKLTIDNSEFKSVLSERIKLGQGIYNLPVTNSEEYRNLLKKYSSWDDYNSEFLKQCFNKPENEYKGDYDNAGYTLLGEIRYDNNPYLQQKGIINVRIESLKNLLAKADLIKSEVPDTKSQKDTKNTRSISKEEVFIVHGHDEEAKVKTARFIETLGFKPIILHEKASSGKTIIEKIETYSNVGFGIILYTPCDIGGKQETNPKLKSRARQNVVFEHGFLIGKIGRNNVCALVKGEIETPNDISGVVYIPMDKEEAWQVKIAKELRSSGYNVDMNKII